MNIKVLKPFADKRTGAVHKAGNELEVTTGRFAEINGTPSGVLVEEIKKNGRKEEGEINVARRIIRSRP